MKYLDRGLGKVEGEQKSFELPKGGGGTKNFLH